MTGLEIIGLIGIVIELSIAIGAWIVAYNNYQEYKRGERIDCLIKRIRERAEDSGNESDGDKEELCTLLLPSDPEFVLINN
ncbi:Vpu protein [Simian immunodeficiency virus]|uniref:Protein Vpu n=1 Tax=Simian immunodeficiency virus TaxID=11723 RepID=S4SU71_SIV|nr:vpu protein [Simian immunodeficiency virus]AKC01960.1 Vpu protein [Simian immunodeficiency virus]